MPWRSGRSLWHHSEGQLRILTTPCSLPESAPRFRPRFPSRTIHASSQSLQRVTNAQLEAGIRGNDPAEKLRVQGIVRSIRKQKRVAFAAVADGTTANTVHAVLTPELAKNITNGSYVDLTGRRVTSLGKGQSHDLQVDSVNEIGGSDAEENPVQKKVTSGEFLRTIPHFRVRTQLASLLTRARSHLIRSVGDYFEQQSEEPAVQVHPPAITSSDCEGAGEVFTITPATPAGNADAPEAQSEHFFGEPKYLTVSNQLHLEAWSAELGNVWALAPTFRAEASETPRHLAEFYMLEAEFRGTTSLDDVISQAEKLIRHVTSQLTTHPTGRDLLAYYTSNTHNSRPLVDSETGADLATRWTSIMQADPWPRMTYSEALKLLEAAYNEHADIFEYKPSWDDGLALEHEKWLVQSVTRHTPLIVTDYPAHHKPFYMLPNSALPVARSSPNVDPARGETAACFDILLPFGYAEVCGGSLREHRLEHLIAAMRTRKMLKSRRPLSHLASAAAAAAAAGGPEASDSVAPELPLQADKTLEIHGDAGSSFPQSPSPPSALVSIYPYLEPNESLGSLQWYADLRRFGSSPHGGFGIGFDRLMAYLVGVNNIRDVVGFPRGYKHCHC